MSQVENHKSNMHMCKGIDLHEAGVHACTPYGLLPIRLAPNSDADSDVHFMSAWSCTDSAALW